MEKILPLKILSQMVGLMVTGIIVTYGNTTSLAAGPLRMATTTSTQNSGLLDDLLPRFEQSGGSKVQVIAVGTGKALRLGEAGDVDLVMVHAPKAEMKYLAQGAFVDRRPLMHNYFVVLGPPDDPARAKDAKNTTQLLMQVAKTKSNFISRGDNSGTHIKERALWKTTGIKPEGDWYHEVGQGMGQTLIVASEKGAYTLSDEATFFSFMRKLRLEIVSRPEPALANPYSVMAVNPKRHPNINNKAAQQLMNWLTSAQGQNAIANYRKLGKQLFTPDAKP